MRSRLWLVVALALVFGGVACKKSGGSAAASAVQTATGAAPAASAPAPDANSRGRVGTKIFTGTVAETMSSGGYTYARLQAGGTDDVWIAAPQFEARVGEQLSASLDMPMQNFESRTLHRSFPLLYFVAEVARDGGTLVGTQQGAPPALMTSHGASSARPAAPAVARMEPPPGGLSVADVFARRAQMSGKTVSVRGTVVKVNIGILDRNWIHIQDGSGAAASKDNDLTITTDAPAEVGDVITASGVLGTNRDFGAGYAYDAILEKANIKK